MMSTITVNSYEFNYIEKGMGDPLMFVHGSVSDYRTWYLQQQVFSKYYHTMAYSRRYHWPNRQIPEDEDYSMLQHVDDLEALIREFSPPVHLIGHSYGAFIGLMLTMRSPQLVRTLILAEPPAITLFVSSNPKPGELLKLLFSRPKTALAMIKFGAQGITPATQEIKRNNTEKAIEIFGKATLGKETFNKLSNARKAQVFDNLIKAEFLGSGYPSLNEREIQNIKKPTLLLNGENSPKLFHLLLDRVDELIPQNERKVITGASHIMHEDNAAEFNKTVLSFIEKRENR